MPSKKTCFKHMFERVENRSHRCSRSQFKYNPLGMKHGLEGENRISLDQNRNGVSIHEESEDGRLTPRLYELNERQRVCQRAPAFHDSLVSFLFVHLLCLFTHISFKPLNFLYFKPLLKGYIYLTLLQGNLFKASQIKKGLKQYFF